MAGWFHEVIAYVGDGVDDHVIATTVPLDVGAVTVICMHAPASDATVSRAAWVRNSACPANTSFCEACGPLTTGIKAFTVAGFTVGVGQVYGSSYESVNQAGEDYIAIVMRDTTADGTYMKVGVYTGTGEIIKYRGQYTGGSIVGDEIHDNNTPLPQTLWPLNADPGGTFGDVDFPTDAIIVEDAVARGAFGAVKGSHYDLGSPYDYDWELDLGTYKVKTDGLPAAPDGFGAYMFMKNGRQAVDTAATHMLVAGFFWTYASSSMSPGHAMEMWDDGLVYGPPGGAGVGLMSMSTGEVGPSVRTNALDMSCMYSSFNIASGFKSFTGVGTGSDVAVTGLGFAPAFAIARQFQAGQPARWRTTIGTPGTYHSGTESQGWSYGGGGGGATRDTTEGIKSMDADGITVGTNVAPNGVPFYGFALYATGQVDCQVSSTAGDPPPSQGVIGPLVWMEWQRRVPSTDLAESSIVTDVYSDQDMQCPASWYGGFKEARIIKAGTSERALSDQRTGDWTGSTFDITVSDYDRSIRQRLASVADNFTVRMTTRDNRAALGIPYTVFVGPIIDAQPVAPMAFQLTIGDMVSRGLLADNAQQPWRLIRDGFLDQLDWVSQNLDPMQTEPIGYGEHRRQVTAGGSPIDPPSAHGFVYKPIYLGIEGGKHIWLNFGHACADVPDIFVDGASVAGDEGTVWERPGYTNPKYEDRRSSTYGVDRRYSLTKGIVGQADADACAAGTKILTIAVDGIEPCGDGLGAVITDRLDQYKHFIINYVANKAALSYQSGAWLSTPYWTILDGDIPIVEEASWDACKAIALLRMPPDGYIGAAVIGYVQASVRKWIADWNRSCSTRFGVTHDGQLCVVMLHPTAAIKAAAPLYTAAHEILKASFGTRLAYDEMTNRLPFVADFYGVLGKWMTTGVAEDGLAMERYGDIVGEQREYPFAPGFSAAAHLAHMAVLQSVDPPRVITFEASLGPFNQTSATDLGESLGYLDLGDYVRYEHYAAVGAPAEMRLAWVDTHQVQTGARKGLIEALDCEALIDFDLPEESAGSGSPSNEVCADAIVITDAEALQDDGYSIVLDTSVNATDGSAPVLSCGDGVAYHAAWFSVTPAADRQGYITTITSDYDTVLGLFTGACGALTEIRCNDNQDILKTSRIEVEHEEVFAAGVTHLILVHGYRPDDGGTLRFKLKFFAD